MRCFSRYNIGENNAGPKAKIDIERVLKENYASKNFTIHLSDGSKKSKIRYILDRMKFTLFYGLCKDICIIQHPFTLKKRLLSGIRNKIAFVHDLQGLRLQDSNIERQEIEILKTFNILIVHNDKMKEYLIKHDLDEKNIIVLELFDYLCDKNIQYNFEFIKFNTPEIVYVGNFSKSQFLNQIAEEKMNFIMNLYGNGIYDKNNRKLNYCGSFLPDELPNIIKGDLGLVWDGNIDDTDENSSFKNYTKFNNPHKLSCYIASGIPVIVWEKSAVSKFVLDNNIGYVINNLYDINNLDFSDYLDKKKNVMEICKKIRNGFYTKKAIEKCLEKVEK